MENKTVDEIKFSLEKSQRLHQINGKIVGNSFQIPLGKGHVQGVLGCLLPLIMLGSFLAFCGFLIKLTRGTSDWKMPAICFSVFLLVLFISFFVKKSLIIDFNKKSIYTRTMLFGNQCDKIQHIADFSDISRFAIDTVPARHVIKDNHGHGREAPLDSEIIKSRNFNAFKDFYDFFSNLIIITKTGSIVNFYPVSLYDEEYPKLVLVGKSLSDAFGVPFYPCTKDKKLFTVNEGKITLLMALKTWYDVKPSNVTYKGHVKLDEKGELVVLPVFSENDCIKLEAEAKREENSIFKLAHTKIRF